MLDKLLIIFVIVFILVYFQLKLIIKGKERINLLQSIFELGNVFARDQGNKVRYTTKDIFVPRKLLKRLSWKEIKQDIDNYCNYSDDFKFERSLNTIEYSRRSNFISSLEKQLQEISDTSEIKKIRASIRDEKNALLKDKANGKLDIIKSTLVCKKEDKEKIEIILINNNNLVAQEIEQSINTYLLRNKGAVSDFNLIKDIVERNCDAVATEIESITPMPLYLGLAGTMSGIVIGLGIIGMTKGFSDIQNVVDSLMAEVALAMTASLIGVLSTTYLSWKSRTCNSVVEADKNKFYTWIQTELLPVLSSNTVTTLTLLERNLSKFNESFGNTIVRLDEKLSKVGETYSQQLEILRRIEKLDVTKMATANVKILSALDSSSGNIENFARYMDSSTAYLSEVRNLTNELDGYLARTGSLETIADFYKKQMNEIALRQDAIKTTVISVDDTLQKALSDLEEHTESALMGLKQTYIKQQDEMERIAQQQGDVLNDKFTKLDTIIEFIGKLQPLLGQISRMETAINNAANRAESASRSEINAINNLADTIKKNRYSSRTSSRLTATSGENAVEYQKKGLFSSFAGLITRLSRRSDTIKDDSQSDQPLPPASDQTSGQWYEQGKLKRAKK